MSGTNNTVIIQDGGVFNPTPANTHNGVLYIIRNKSLSPMSVNNVINYGSVTEEEISVSGGITRKLLV
ncbi:hypothetical protein [uncultured Chryseobacterium sp.]|uniref:hypothetical protein n=1 Tax=uncultured Chryseobacterium sp. TaxID=259322 RepID=UPI0027DC86D5|nr:hypothetical protein [uncultured Chryseobacterium sp.]